LLERRGAVLPPLFRAESAAEKEAHPGKKKAFPPKGFLLPKARFLS
jgi:hypothetical protein